MSTNQILSGDQVPFTAAGTLSAGDVLVLGDLVGVVANDCVSGDLNYLQVEGCFARIPKLSTDVVAVGADLWWDAGNSRMTLTASTHKYAGKAIAAAGNGVATVDIKLVQALQAN